MPEGVEEDLRADVLSEEEPHSEGGGRHGRSEEQDIALTKSHSKIDEVGCSMLGANNDHKYNRSRNTIPQKIDDDKAMGKHSDTNNCSNIYI